MVIFLRWINVTRNRKYLLVLQIDLSTLCREVCPGGMECGLCGVGTTRACFGSLPCARAVKSHQTSRERDRQISFNNGNGSRIPGSMQVGNEPEHSPTTKLSLDNMVSGSSSTSELLSTRRAALVDLRGDSRTPAVLVTYGWPAVTLCPILSLGAAGSRATQWHVKLICHVAGKEFAGPQGLAHPVRPPPVPRAPLHPAHVHQVRAVLLCNRARCL